MGRKYSPFLILSPLPPISRFAAYFCGLNEHGGEERDFWACVGRGTNEHVAARATNSCCSLSDGGKGGERGRGDPCLAGRSALTSLVHAFGHPFPKKKSPPLSLSTLHFNISLPRLAANMPFFCYPWVFCGNALHPFPFWIIIIYRQPSPLLFPALPKVASARSSVGWAGSAHPSDMSTR